MLKLTAVRVKECLFDGKWFKIIAEDDSGLQKEYTDSFSDEAQTKRLIIEMERNLPDSLDLLSEYWD